MEINGIDCYVVDLPMRRPHRWRGLTASVGSAVLVRVRTDTGLQGWGEASVMAQWGGDFGRYYGETPTTVTHVVNDLIWPVLAGRDPRDHRLARAEMDSAVRGHPYAKQAVDAAVLELVAQDAQVPVHQLLGGRRRTAVPVGHIIALMPVAEVVDEARAVAAEGISMVKLKAGEDVERDVEAVYRVREAVGDAVDIAVDANYGWEPVPVAAQLIARLSHARLRYVEQPVAGIAAMAQLASRVDTPLMVDESMWTARDMAETAHEGAAMLASVYAGKLGGLHEAMQADAVAVAHGIRTHVNAFAETGIGALANLHLAAAMTSLDETCLLPLPGQSGLRATRTAGVIYTDDVLTAAPAYRDGRLQVPDGPGWGIPVDFDKVEHYAVRRHSMGD